MVITRLGVVLRTALREASREALKGRDRHVKVHVRDMYTLGTEK
jgi:hypothetical protein